MSKRNDLLVVRDKMVGASVFILPIRSSLYLLFLLLNAFGITIPNCTLKENDDYIERVLKAIEGKNNGL